MEIQQSIIKNVLPYFNFLFCLLIAGPLYSYSILRPYNGSPILATSWINKNPLKKQKRKKHPINYLQDSHLEVFPLFKTFDRAYFYHHMLPEEPIPFRYFPEQTIDPQILKEAITKFFQEVRLGYKKNFSDFIILKDEAFNSRKQAGLIIVKGKKWPLDQFVVKLFMETPRSFIQPSNKGFIAICHFIVGHGCTRYMLGFTRLKNLEMMRSMIKDSPYWSEKVDFPRKWFWLPEDYPWIHLAGYHMGGYEKIALDIPGAYAIIADAIHVEREFSIKIKEDRDLGIAICNYLECLMDPHSSNFVIEANTNKIVIIDTEHSPTMVGLKDPIHMESYSQWYSFLVKKGAHEYFCRTKGERQELQRDSRPPYEGPKKYLPQIYSHKESVLLQDLEEPEQTEQTVQDIFKEIDKHFESKR